MFCPGNVKQYPEFQKMSHFVIARNDDGSFKCGSGFTSLPEAKKRLLRDKDLEWVYGDRKYAVYTKKQAEKFFGPLEIIPETRSIRQRKTA